jgi:hypothetical protein
MNSRTIVTSQPDVACDVCERRLLRGEQPETFLAAGQPRTVCELCAPRAMHQGWKRASDLDAATPAHERPRRTRGIFDRFRAAGRSHVLPEDPGIEAADGGGADALVADDVVGAYDSPAFDAGPLDDDPLVRAVRIFNASEHPRRVGGVARSLGTPEISVRELDVTGVVAIVVAWELCWYRYRIDVDDPAAGAPLVAQGTELAELEREERDVNAVADESGALRLNAAVRVNDL